MKPGVAIRTSPSMIYFADPDSSFFQPLSNPGEIYSRDKMDTGNVLAT